MFSELSVGHFAKTKEQLCKSQLIFPLLLLLNQLLLFLLLSSVCLIKVDQRSGNLYWVSCDQKSIGTITTNGRYPQQLYQTTKEIKDLYLDWLRGGLLWLEDDEILTMSMKGGKAKELLQLTVGGVKGNIAFDLRANSLLWNSKKAGLSLLLTAESSCRGGSLCGSTKRLKH